MENIFLEKNSKKSPYLEIAYIYLEIFDRKFNLNKTQNQKQKTNGFW